MENSRNHYIISKALKRFIFASIMTSAAGQLASAFDAVVLAQFEGEEAVSALSLVMPVTTFISCLGLLFAFGANTLVARAIGRHDTNSASAIFSTSVWAILLFGVGCSVLLWTAVPGIVGAIAPDDSLRALPAEYLGVYVLGAWLEMLSYALCLFVATDGHPRRVTLVVSVGVLTNVVVDVLAVGWYEWGIEGVAWGTLSQYAVNVLLLCFYLRSRSCSYRLVWSGSKMRRLLVQNVLEGAPVTISNVLMAVTVLIINGMAYDAQGEEGLFFWSVCLQMLLISVVFINGVMEALFAIGGVMVGERDVRGFSLLTRDALLAVILLVSVLVVLMWVPDLVGVMFGVEDLEEMADMNNVLRSFSLMIPPFSLTLLLVAAYQVQERIVLSIVVVVGQLVVMMVCVGIFAYETPDDVWLGFPIGGFLFLAGQLLYTTIYSRRQKERLSALTLIPLEEGHSMDCSVRYHADEVRAVLSQVINFLQGAGVEKDTVFKLRLCLEELMMNIVCHSHGRIVHHSFDVHVYTDGGRACVTLKDGGRPFDPVKAGRLSTSRNEIGKNIGLRIVANILPDISYKYMYGLNIVMIKV